jgi:hypothetical protein
VIALTLAGCSSRPTLNVTCLAQKQQFEKTFTQAYATRTDDGDYDIVLVDDPLDEVTPSSGDKPLQPTPVRPMRHLVHIHVMWTPMIGDRGDQPSDTNAAINWYVWGNASGDERDMMHYGGAGFVKIYAGDDSADFKITNASLKLKSSRGNMKDPVGVATLNGRFTAPLNKARVKELLAQLGQDAGNTRITGIDNSAMPGRPVEP